MSRQVKIRLLKGVNFHKPGTVLETAPGNAEMWINQGKAELVVDEPAESLVPDRTNTERMIPQGRKQRRMTS